MLNTPLIVDVKRNALDDGPGIRTLIFFKGCPLSCVWCQNPETKKIAQEILFDKDMCSSCGNCVSICEQNAIDFFYDYRIDRLLCNLCGECISNCNNQAIKFLGRYYEIDELIGLILKDKVFYKNTGGGITLSGGEPLLFIKYVHELLKKLKKKNIHTCIETSGYFNFKDFKKKILPFTDLIYFDIKLYDSKKSKKYCGVNSEIILKNLEKLLKLNETKVLPRIPLIPSITIEKENLNAIADFLLSFNISRIALLPYNPLWLSKCEKIGIKPSFKYNKWLDSKQKEEVKSIFSDFEFKDF